MKALYWAIIFVVSVLSLMIVWRVFRLTVGIPPVLSSEVRELKEEKRALAQFVFVTVFLYVVAMLIGLVGGF